MSGKSNKQLLDFTVDNAPEAIYWVDMDGVIRRVNKAASNLLGYSEKELVGMTVPQVNPGFSIRSLNQHFDELKKSKSLQFRSSQITKSGEEIPVEITSNIAEVDGELMSCTYIRDIQSLENIERVLELSEQRWKAGLEILNEGVWDWDLKNETVSFSKQWQKNFPSPKKGKTFLDILNDLVHPDDFKMLKVRLDDHLNGLSDEYRSKHRIKDIDNQWRWVRDRGKVISRDKEGNAKRIIGATQDVTDIIEAEKKVRLSQEQLLRHSERSPNEIQGSFLDIFNNSSDAIFIGDPQKNKVIDANPKVCELLGYTKEELLEQPLTEIIPNQRKSFIDFYNRVISNKSARTDRLVFKSKRGSRVFTEVSASVFQIGDKSGILGILHTESDEEKFQKVIGQVSEASIINPNKGIVNSFIAESCKVLRVQYAGMTRIVSENPMKVKVISFWNKDHFDETFEYEVKDSPCDHVVGGDFLIVGDKASEKFPDSKLFEKIPANSYMAVPISDSKKNPLGHFFLCDDGIMERKNWIENLMRLGALRMRLGIERLEAQQELKEVNQNLEKKVKERTKELELALQEVEDLRDKLEAENVYLKEEIKLNHNFEDIISQDKGFKKVLKEIEKVAATNSTVLILGETGTGKEVLTRSIHNISKRKEKPLVKVNCAALPATLIESELFGHEKGAYTGATAMKCGRFELADGGTLFLDEVGEIPIELQPKLLRALQEGEFERVGGVKTLKVDVRVIAATNRDLEKAIDKGEFRSDLYYRLNVFPINVPPLRERKDDIALLIKHFVGKYNQKLGKEVSKIPQSIINQLTKYPWPGNVRELENIIERAVIISEGKNLKIGNWLKGEVEADDKLDVTLSENERTHILKVLNHTNWKISGKNGAAEILDIKPTTLESRMKKLNITRPKIS